MSYTSFNRNERSIVRELVESARGVSGHTEHRKSGQFFAS